MQHGRRVNSWALRLCAAAVVVACGACGGGSSSSARTPISAAPVVVVPAAQPAGALPSASTQMVCASEGQREIATSIGVSPTQPVVGRWRDHVYSCDYVYAPDPTTSRVKAPTMVLSVKELPNPTETAFYFNALAVRLGRVRSLQGLGQGAFQTTSGSTVVRKDNRVLLVDITRLGAHLGVPTSPRADIALSVAATIMGCWTGE